jgi:hypothetical protein
MHEQMTTPSLRIDDAFRALRKQVSRKTDVKQEPEILQDDLEQGGPRACEIAVRDGGGVRQRNSYGLKAPVASPTMGARTQSQGCLITPGNAMRKIMAVATTVIGLNIASVTTGFAADVLETAVYEACSGENTSDQLEACLQSCKDARVAMKKYLSFTLDIAHDNICKRGQYWTTQRLMQ